MGRLRRLAPLFAAVTLAMAGVALGAQLQEENAIPADLPSQQMSSQRAATGNVVALTALLAAGGLAWATCALAPRPVRASEWRPVLAFFAGSYIAVSLVQTVWPNYVSLDAGTQRLAMLHVNLMASNTLAVPSVLVPVFALLAGALLLLFWGGRRILRPDAVPAPLARRHAGTLLLAAPFLVVAAAGCMRLLVALPPVPGATPYRVLLSLASLAFLGLLVAGLAKAWQLARAGRDRRLAPLAAEAWEGLGRAEAGLAGLLGLLALAALFMPAFPPDPEPCASLRCASDPVVQYGPELRAIGDLLASGQTFVTRQLHVHLGLLLAALLPLAPMVALHREGSRSLDAPGGPPLADKGPWLAVLAGALAASFLLGALATWILPGALWAWVFAAMPAALAGRFASSLATHAQGILLAAWAAWCLGNSLSASYDADSAGLQFVSSPTVSELWRLLGAVLAAWGMARILRGHAVDVRPSTAIPLVGGAALAILALILLELPLDIWGKTWSDLGTAHAPSVFVGTEVARADGPASVALHLLSWALALGAAAMAARLIRPEWFQRPGAPAAALPRAAPARA